MAIPYSELVERHPCFAIGQKSSKGRIHLPTSPTCNIECKFCSRKINDYEDRPGVSSTVITPEEAVDAVKRAIGLCGNITVAGIAGPGDTLASPYALETFRLVKEAYPGIIKCMSTNGLLLSEKADEIIDAGIDTLTVTVNAVDPEIEAKINGRILYHGKVIEGVEAAEILIRNQLEGIAKVADGGVTVKVNTVFVPGVNGSHIPEIAKTVKAVGARMYNIIPMIPMNEFKNLRPPSCAEIDKARAEAERFIKVFRHCSRCRADAVGTPGEKDYGSQIYLKRVQVEETFSHG